MTARQLTRAWKLDVAHALYHHRGDWYHLLKRFPAALLDPQGYVLFCSQREYQKHPRLQRSAHLHVPGGIRHLAEYVFVGKSRARREARTYLLPEEFEPTGYYREGRTKLVQVDVYERSLKARRHCVRLFGCSCSVCGFNFKKIFGEIGEGFIHVHHLRDLAAIGVEYKVNPAKDLRPVCPNCHAMLHTRVPALTISELRRRITRRRR